MARWQIRLKTISGLRYSILPFAIFLFVFSLRTPDMKHWSVPFTASLTLHELACTICCLVLICSNVSPRKQSCVFLVIIFTSCVPCVCLLPAVEPGVFRWWWQQLSPGQTDPAAATETAAGGLWYGTAVLFQSVSSNSRKEHKYLHFSFLAFVIYHFSSPPYSPPLFPLSFPVVLEMVALGGTSTHFCVLYHKYSSVHHYYTMTTFFLNFLPTLYFSIFPLCNCRLINSCFLCVCIPVYIYMLLYL